MTRSEIMNYVIADTIPREVLTEIQEQVNIEFPVRVTKREAMHVAKKLREHDIVPTCWAIVSALQKYYESLVLGFPSTGPNNYPEYRDYSLSTTPPMRADEPYGWGLKGSAAKQSSESPVD